MCQIPCFIETTALKRNNDDPERQLRKKKTFIPNYFSTDADIQHAAYSTFSDLQSLNTKMHFFSDVRSSRNTINLYPDTKMHVWNSDVFYLADTKHYKTFIL